MTATAGTLYFDMFRDARSAVRLLILYDRLAHLVALSTSERTVLCGRLAHLVALGEQRQRVGGPLSGLRGGDGGRRRLPQRQVRGQSGGEG